MADDVPLSFYLPGGLYLKHEAKILIQVRLPEIKNPGVTVSNWEVMEKLKAQAQPEEFQNLRVSSSSREIIKFEGEFETLRVMRKVVLLLNGKTIKLKGFSDPLKVRAAQAETPHPTQQSWEEFFVGRGVEVFSEGKPGERPDTMHIRGLPIKWFSSKYSEGKPCPRVLTQAFQKFGKVRQVGFFDPSDSLRGSQQSFFGPGAASRFLNFEAYIQYEKYPGFCNAMNSLKGMMLMRLQAGGEAVARIKVDYDRTGFLSDRGIRKRIALEEKKKKEEDEVEVKRSEEQLLEEQVKKEEQETKESEEKAKKSEEKAKKSEEKRERKRKQAELIATLREVAIQRRAEAQQLLSVLLAGAAEARYQEELREKVEQEAAIQASLKEKQFREEAVLKNQLIQNVQQLQQRKLALQQELSRRDQGKRTAGRLGSPTAATPEEKRKRNA